MKNFNYKSVEEHKEDSKLRRLEKILRSSRQVKKIKNHLILLESINKHKNYLKKLEY